MFDPSAPHIIILLVVVLLLFGSTRLPGAAKSLGEAMHIFKKEIKGKPADPTTVSEATPAAPQQLTNQASDPAQQAQIDALQSRLDAMQRTGDTATGSSSAEQHDTRSF